MPSNKKILPFFLPDLNHVHGTEEVGPRAVHLVDKAHPRNAVLVRLGPGKGTGTATVR